MFPKDRQALTECHVRARLSQMFLAEFFRQHLPPFSFIQARQAVAESIKHEVPLVSMVVAAPIPMSVVCSAGCSQKKHSPRLATLAPLKAWIVSCHSIF